MAAPRGPISALSALSARDRDVERADEVTFRGDVSPREVPAAAVVGSRAESAESAEGYRSVPSYGVMLGDRRHAGRELAVALRADLATPYTAQVGTWALA